MISEPNFSNMLLISILLNWICTLYFWIEVILKKVSFFSNFGEIKQHLLSYEKGIDINCAVLRVRSISGVIFITIS